DTSQNGNGAAFRNETLANRAAELSSAWFVHIPTQGTARFDFVSTARP
ncbi:unnamed protein product, partial [Phaeothamnion confervicola]